MIRVVQLFAGRIKSYGSYESAIEKDLQNQLLVTEDGVDGDEAAHDFHGGPNRAVHQLPSEHYADWEMPPGHLGENISSIGMFETTVCIGDRWRFGEVLLEVSQPRAPCFKTSRRSGISGFAQMLDLTQRSGWFYRVIEPGTIKPGINEPELIDRPYPELTVAEVHQLANPDLFPKSADFHQLCLNCPVLDDYWKQLIRVDSATLRRDRRARLGLDSGYPWKMILLWLVCGIAIWWILTM